MFWLTRPPYLRWAAAALMLVGAMVWDLRGRAGEPYPFAARPITAGATITETDVVWRTVPGDLLATPDLSAPVASRAIAAGEPILPSALDADGGIPDGWWSVPVALPAATTVGARVRLIVPGPGVESNGIVMAVGTEDLFAVGGSGLVAVPPEHAPTVALAAMEGTLIVLVAP